jgi:DNA-binding response OmpR family regulator
MLTVLDEEAKMVEAMRLGALDYILKPLYPEALSEALPIWP